MQMRHTGTHTPDEGKGGWLGHAVEFPTAGKRINSDDNKNNKRAGDNKPEYNKMILSHGILSPWTDGGGNIHTYLHRYSALAPCV